MKAQHTKQDAGFRLAVDGGVTLFAHECTMATRPAEKASRVPSLSGPGMREVVLDLLVCLMAYEQSQGRDFGTTLAEAESEFDRMRRKHKAGK